MFDEKNFQIVNDNAQSKNKAKKFWKAVGTVVLSLVLATLTIVVLSINR